jgi:hypothetical protein
MYNLPPATIPNFIYDSYQLLSRHIIHRKAGYDRVFFFTRLFIRIVLTKTATGRQPNNKSIYYLLITY